MIISNDEIEDIIKIIKSLEDSGLLLKGITETFQNEVNEQKGGFLNMLFGTLGATLDHNTTLIISNDEIEDIIEIIKSLEYSGLLLKRVIETV